tara:strand:- start:66684 stop:67595 length:912 start_codon:yes stop_codon:yes gene_type:complete
MNEAFPPTEIIFRATTRAACMESRLVLESAGIQSHVSKRDHWWILSVAAHDRVQSIVELEAYQQDNAERVNERPTKVTLFAGGVVGCAVYAIVLILVDFYVRFQTFGLPWLQAGQMQSGMVTAGQWWRVVTALTLHADAQHLCSNLAFGCVFGLMAGRILGGGVAWLAIVVSGSIGNLLNALTRNSEHTSIGASTAVFATLGIMVSHALHPRWSTYEKPMKRWSPLIAGILLLAFIGVGGERTDVGAHVTGFLAGLVIGWVGCRLPERLIADRRVQVGAGVAAVTIVIMAWTAAFVIANGHSP